MFIHCIFVYTKLIFVFKYYLFSLFSLLKENDGSSQLGHRKRNYYLFALKISVVLSELINKLNVPLCLYKLKPRLTFKSLMFLFYTILQLI